VSRVLSSCAVVHRIVGDRTGTSYVPAAFAREEEARRNRVTGKELEAAMHHLFEAGKIRNEPHGRPGEIAPLWREDLLAWRLTVRVRTPHEKPSSVLPTW